MFSLNRPELLSGLFNFLPHLGVAGESAITNDLGTEQYHTKPHKTRVSVVRCKLLLIDNAKTQALLIGPCKYDFDLTLNGSGVT